MSGALVGTMMGTRPITLSGSLSKTAAPSGGYVTSDTVTVAVPAGSNGGIDFLSYVETGTVGDLQYQKNGGSWTTVTEGTTVTFANGDTLALRAGALISAGEAMNFRLADNTIATTIQNVAIAAS